MPVFATRAHMMQTQAEAGGDPGAGAARRSGRAAGGASAAASPWRPDPASWAPAALFNGMVAPAVDYAIKGVIWYQGESNSRRGFAPMYAKSFRP
jgi:sialate O-acetylesterase